MGGCRPMSGPTAVTFKGPAVRVISTSPASRVVGTLRVKGGGGQCRGSRCGRSAIRPGTRRLLCRRLRFGLLPIRLSLPAIADQECDRLGRLGTRAGHRKRSDVRAFHGHEAVDGGRERLIVHLYSDLNTTAFHALPNDDVPLREEIVPIHDMKVTFGPGIDWSGPPRAGRAGIRGRYRGRRVERRCPAARYTCDGRG